MTNKIERAIDVAISDLHIGSKLGLCAPEALLDLGGKYIPNIWQQWAWKAWGMAWDWVDSYISEASPDYTHLTICGDLVDIDIKNRSGQIWGRSQVQVRDAAITILEPVINKFDAVHFIKGTEAHNGLNNETEDLIAGDFDNHVHCEDTNEPAWWSADFELCDVLFNAAHHGRMGQKPWTKKNPIESLRAEIIMHRFNSGERVPDVVYRGHFHQYKKTDVDEPCFVVQLHGWQLKTAFVNRIDPADTRPSVGVVITDCHNGTFKHKAKTYTLPREAVWKPEKNIIQEMKQTTKKRKFLGSLLGN